jgi:hypothetical protein
MPAATLGVTAALALRILPGRKDALVSGRFAAPTVFRAARV